jgi:hypothetical protein
MPRQPMTAAFNLPPGAPADVATAHAAYDELISRRAQAVGDRDDARAAIADAKTADRETAANAYTAGREPRDLHKQERAAVERLERATVRIDALEAACEQAAVPMLRAIEEHRDQWLADAQQARDQARERYAEAIEQAQAAARDLGLAESAVGWLEAYTVRGTYDGHVRSWLQKSRLTVTARHALRANRDPDVEDLLKLAATAANPPADRCPRKLTTAKASA